MAILFQNKQWAVTDAGLHSIEPYQYEIPAERLLETANDSTKLYDWPYHMAEKTWIDMAAFEEAFRKATEVHAGKYKGLVDPALLDESFVAGWKRLRYARGS